MTKIEIFDRAFDSHTGHCRTSCECGKEFYDHANSYDWEEGEKEKLEADPNAVGVSYTVGTLTFEGRKYCCDCTCWHARAEHIMGFIDNHAAQIAEYLTLQKKEKQRVANAAPVVH